MKYNTARPYAASYLVFRKDGKIACVLRKNTNWMDGYYGVPAGKIEKGESAAAAAIREAKEEVGVVIAPEHLTLVLTGHRNSKGDDMTDWVDFWFEASEWEGELVNAEPEVHGELAWFAIDALPDNLIPYNRVCIEKIASGKSSYAEFDW